MARWERDRGKERYWRRLLRQWQRSGQEVRAYCVEHGVSEPSFYAWRRTIQERDRQAERRSRPRRRRAGGQVQGSGAHAGSAPRRPAFVPVTITAPAPALEVVLHDGRVLRIPAGFDATTLRQLLAVLDEARSC